MCLHRYQGIRESILHSLSSDTSASLPYGGKLGGVFVRCFVFQGTGFVMHMIIPGMRAVGGCLPNPGTLVNGLAFALKWKKPILCGTEKLAFTCCWIISGRQFCWPSHFLLCGSVCLRNVMGFRNTGERRTLMSGAETAYLYTRKWWGEWAENGREYAHSDCMALQTIE